MKWPGKLSRQLALLAASAGTSLSLTECQALPIYSAGHADIRVAYSDGEIQFEYHFDGSGQTEDGTDIRNLAIPADEIFTRVADASQRTLPATPTWGFTGAPAGAAIFILPMTQDVNLPWLGFSTENLISADWAGGIRLTLTGVTAPAGGQVSLFSTGSFGTPTVLWDTADGIQSSASDLDRLTLPQRTHAHYNWAFTAPGVYSLELSALGTRRTGELVTGTGTLTFLVGDSTAAPLSPVPEPGGMALTFLAISTVFLGGRRFRRSLAGSPAAAGGEQVSALRSVE